jgi:precorrin-4/cobalt-precorrin-4 C11-methyltransferase
MKVYFIGAGPGDPDLITVRGADLVSRADIIIYAGSLVNPALLERAKPEADIYNSASMNLEEVCKLYRENADSSGIIARLHTGDPSLYGAVQEQFDFCRDNNIPFEVVPGVSSMAAACANLRQELTLPGISQSVIVSRNAGRTGVPEGEELEQLGRFRTSMVLFLSVQAIREVCGKLVPHYGRECPVAVVYRVTWPEERIIRGTLGDIANQVEEAGISRQALIFVGRVLDARLEQAEQNGAAAVYRRSKLYDPGFSHGFRKVKS